jgi:hypothetical protein
MFRYLRIAVSVLSLIACVLLIVLWVRSYWWFEVVYYRPAASTMFQVVSSRGVVRFTDCSEHSGWYAGAPRLPIVLPSVAIGWSHDSRWYAGYTNEIANDSPFKKVFRGFDRPNRFGWQVPFWFFVLFAAVLGISPWSRRWNSRFSLRTLLIAVTLVAVLLGAAVYAVK